MLRTHALGTLPWAAELGSVSTGYEPWIPEVTRSRTPSPALRYNSYEHG